MIFRLLNPYSNEAFEDSVAYPFPQSFLKKRNPKSIRFSSFNFNPHQPKKSFDSLEITAQRPNPFVGFPKNRTVINSNLLTLNSNSHNEKQQI